MPISVRCACGAKLKAKDSLAGKKVACPKCKQPLLIEPAATSDPAATSAPAGDLKPLDAPSEGDLGDVSGGLDPWAGDDLGAGDGLGAAAAPASDPFELGDFSESELATGAPTTFGTPASLPAPAPKPVAGAKKSGGKKKGGSAIDQRMILIGAIGGGAALLLCVGGGVVLWLVFSGGPENVVAENDRAGTPSSATAGGPQPPNQSGQAPGQAGMPGQPGMTEMLGSPEQPGMSPEGPANPAPPGQRGTADGTGGGTPANLVNSSQQGGNPGPPGKMRQDNGLAMKFCLCPPGKFLFGEQRVAAEITHPYWMSMGEVSQRQWRLVMNSTPWAEMLGESELGDNLPACMMSWNEAVAFGEKMTQVERQLGRIDGNLEYRLPTEAEWYYACMAGASSLDGPTPAAGEVSRFRTREIAAGQPNAWGIYDMLGNLSEWTLDRFETTAQARAPLSGGPNPIQWHPVDDDNHYVMVRVGGPENAVNARARLETMSSDRAIECGFRVVLAPPIRPAQTPTPAPAPANEPLWVVLSNLEIDPSATKYQVSVDWKLVQGRPDPGKKYVIFVSLKSLTGVSSNIQTMDIDLVGPQGTIEGEFPSRDANGVRVVSTMVLGEEEGLGFRNLASGELKVGEDASAEKPPAR